MSHHDYIETSNPCATKRGGVDRGAAGTETAAKGNGSGAAPAQTGRKRNGSGAAPARTHTKRNGSGAAPADTDTTRSGSGAPASGTIVNGSVSAAPLDLARTAASEAATAPAPAEAFAERIFRAAGGAMEIFSVYLGDRLGFYQVLGEDGPCTSLELARRTGAHERYAREWLEQQAVIGILQVDDPALAPAARRFRLPAAHAEALARPDAPAYVAPLAQAIAGAVLPLPAVVEAFRTGSGVPFTAYGPDLREGQARMNRTILLRQLGEEWIPALPDLDARLRSDPPARVADIGCGGGWSSIGVARNYPRAVVDGFDLDAASIELAQANLRETAAGAEDLSARVRFQVRDAADEELAGEYDLVMAFECVHDMSDPVGVLRTARRLLRPGGQVLIMDERTAERFDPEAGGFEWLLYGFSILHCLPAAMAEQPSADTGTVMRTETLRGYAREAGFAEFEVLPIGNEMFRFYRLRG